MKRASRRDEVPSNPYSEYRCPHCGKSRNGYENHHCTPKFQKKYHTPVDRIFMAAYLLVLHGEERKHERGTRFLTRRTCIVLEKDYLELRRALRARLKSGRYSIPKKPRERTR